MLRDVGSCLWGFARTSSAAPMKAAHLTHCSHTLRIDQWFGRKVAATPYCRCLTASGAIFGRYSLSRYAAQAKMLALALYVCGWAIRLQPLTTTQAASVQSRAEGHPPALGCLVG